MMAPQEPNHYVALRRSDRELLDELREVIIEEKGLAKLSLIETLGIVVREMHQQKLGKSTPPGH